MQEVSVKGKAGEVKYEGTVFSFDSISEYREFLGTERKSTDVNKDVLKAINDYEGRRQRQNLRSEANPASGGTGAREVNKDIKGALAAGVSPDELKAAIASLKAGKSKAAIASLKAGKSKAAIASLKAGKS